MALGFTSYLMQKRPNPAVVGGASPVQPSFGEFARSQMPAGGGFTAAAMRPNAPITPTPVTPGGGFTAAPLRASAPITPTPVRSSPPAPAAPSAAPVTVSDRFAEFARQRQAARDAAKVGTAPPTNPVGTPNRGPLAGTPIGVSPAAQTTGAMIDRPAPPPVTMDDENRKRMEAARGMLR